MISSPFFIRTLIASIAVGITLSLLSNLVVLRNFAFAGLGITHSLIGGLGIGLLIGLSPTLSIIITAILVGVLIGFTTLRGKLTGGTAIGIIFPIFMAAGIMALFFANKYSSDLLGYLFGNPLLITRTELFIMIAFTFILILWLWAFFKQIIFITFDSELARASGVNVDLYHILFTVMLALAIATATKLVGVILVAALLVLPAATALLIVRNYKAMFLFSLLFGLTATVGGLYLSLLLNLPPGATVVLLAGAIYIFILMMTKLIGSSK